MADLFRAVNPIYVLAFGIWAIASCLSLATSVLIFNRSVPRLWSPRLVREVAVTCYATLVTVSIIESFHRILLALNPTQVFVPARYLMAALMVVSALCVAGRYLSVLLLSGIAAASLPFAEATPPGVFTGLLIASGVALGLRAVTLIVHERFALRESITWASVSQGIDRLPSALCFASPTGRILLSNERMSTLMSDVTGSRTISSDQLWARLSSLSTQPGVKAEAVIDKVSCHLPDQTTWLFCRDELAIGKQPHVQITAHDVTREWNLTSALRTQLALLEQRRHQLLSAIALADQASRASELFRARQHVHDVFGSQLSLLLMLLRERVDPPADLAEQLGALRTELRIGPQRDPARELDGLRAAFTQIGVQLRLPESLPSEPATARLFADIIREATTNAVKHGAASEITATTTTSAHHYCLRITNNGLLGSLALRPGSGLSMIRQRLGQIGGKLTLTTTNRFVLDAVVPLSWEA